MNLIVLDTETSDLDPAKGAAILEIAWMNIENEGGWHPTHHHEYFLQHSGPISPHARALNHIDPDKLRAANGAITRNDMMLQLIKELGPETYFAAHNAEFDSKFLPELTAPWICTYRCAKHLWPNAPGHSNQVLRYWMNIQPEAGIIGTHYPHQALYDVATTAGILLMMLETHSPLELLRLSGAPVQLKTMPWGKHKGMGFHEVPRDYLQWLNNLPDLDKDMRATVNQYLK